MYVYVLVSAKYLKIIFNSHAIYSFSDAQQKRDTTLKTENSKSDGGRQKLDPILQPSW